MPYDRRLVLVGALATCAFLASCGAWLPTACTNELGVEIQPRERTIWVGEEFTATSTGISCGGRQRFPYSVSWISTDPEVAAVDEVSGRVRGLSEGSAGIRATEHGSSSAYWGEVRVTVLPLIRSIAQAVEQ